MKRKKGWECFAYGQWHTCSAWTKSEARAVFKRLIYPEANPRKISLAHPVARVQGD